MVRSGNSWKKIFYARGWVTEEECSSALGERSKENPLSG